nr:multicopper oxidase domain-containing protein [Arthrobacter polaris]
MNSVWQSRGQGRQHQRCRDVFLRIEPLPGYSPLAPIVGARHYGRDLMFGAGHEIGRVTPAEISASTLDALVYREYLDEHYLMPNTAKLVEADVNEPPWYRRVPGSVLYAEPGERLRIHVLNADPGNCHSLHVHGVKYAIESDGAWPFGMNDRLGRRNDEIRPGDSWTYSFDITDETIGVWAFHDHAHSVQMNVNRGLFGALVVRDPAAPAALDVPMFLHAMQAPPPRTHSRVPCCTRRRHKRPSRTRSRRWASLPTTARSTDPRCRAWSPSTRRRRQVTVRSTSRTTPSCRRTCRSGPAVRSCGHSPRTSTTSCMRREAGVDVLPQRAGLRR